MSEKTALSAGSLPGSSSDPQISEESGSAAATANTMCRRASVRYGVQLDRTALERLDGDFGERQEVALWRR